MTDEKELRELVEAARARGAEVFVRHDEDALRTEGRELIDEVKVLGVPGIGPFPMSALAAAEALREALVEMPAYRLRVYGEAWGSSEYEAGETDRRWDELEDDAASEDDLREVLRRFTMQQQPAQSGELSFQVSSNEWDRECFEEGLTKIFTLHVTERDGSPLSPVNLRRAQAVYDSLQPRTNKAPVAAIGPSL